MWYVYILECKDNSLYTGVTNDIKRRLAEHLNKEGGHYTKSRGTKRMVYTEEYTTKSEALKREKQIKGWRCEKKLNLIKFSKPIL